MRRREFLNAAKTSTAVLPITAITAATLPLLTSSALAAPKLVNDSTGTKTEQALAALTQVIADLGESFNHVAWKLDNDDDRAEGSIMLMNTLSHALDSWLLSDPARPSFKRWHNPEKKLLGDNPNSIYFDAPASAEYQYTISGNISGATYTSFTVEVARGTAASGKLGAVKNDKHFDIAADGSYEIIVSAKKPKSARAQKNWLPLAENAVSITTRHYYETVENVSADRLKHIPILIENQNDPGPRPKPTDESVAQNIMRATHWLKATVFPPNEARSPHWVSRVPNQFSMPKLDDSNLNIGYAAKDNTYLMSWFELEEDEALIIRGEWPDCRFANIVLQNLFMQTLNYMERQISVNRKQTQVDDSGRFELIVAHKDPGKPNWLDTEGRRRGVVFCRYQLVKGNLKPLETQLVKLSDIA